jgi:hypothetical protein
MLSDVHLAMLAINSDLCPTDEPICKTLPEVKANVIHNTGRFLMMENSQRFNPALSQSRNGTVAHSSGSAGATSCEQRQYDVCAKNLRIV